MDSVCIRKPSQNEICWHTQYCSTTLLHTLVHSSSNIYYNNNIIFNLCFFCTSDSTHFHLAAPHRQTREPYNLLMGEAITGSLHFHKLLFVSMCVCMHVVKVALRVLSSLIDGCLPWPHTTMGRLSSTR